MAPKTDTLREAASTNAPTRSPDQPHAPDSRAGNVRHHGSPNLARDASDDKILALRLWERREDKIVLLGATQASTVRLRYEKVLPSVTVGTDPVQIRSAPDPLAFATAALAARSRGTRALAGDLPGTAQTATETLIKRYVRPEQIKGRRPKPLWIPPSCDLSIRRGLKTKTRRPPHLNPVTQGAAFTWSVIVIPRAAPCAVAWMDI